MDVWGSGSGLADQTCLMTIGSVKHNEGFAADRFDPPTEILELLNKDGAISA